MFKFGDRRQTTPTLEINSSYSPRQKRTKPTGGKDDRAGATRHEVQPDTSQANAEQGTKKNLLDPSLKEAIEGEFLRTEGR